MKKFQIITSMAVCAVLLASCAGSKQENESTTSANGNGNASQTTIRQPVGEGSAADETAEASAKTIYGEISEVIGNALVIKEIAVPQRRMGSGVEAPGDMAEFTLPDSSEIPLGEDGIPEGISFPEGGEGMPFPMEDGEMPSFDGEGGGDGSMDFEAFESGEGMDFTAGNHPPDSNRQSGGTRQARTQEIQYTGEEMEVIIPVGVPIMTRSMGENGIEETEVAITNVKAGNIITIIYKEDEKTIDTVTITQSSQGRTGMSGDFFMERVEGGGTPGGGMNIMPAPMP